MTGRMLVLAAAATFAPGLHLPTAGQETRDPLDGTRWDLLFYRKSRPIEGRTLTARFEDGRIWGASGCNRFSGSYAVRGDSISIGGLEAGERICPEPEGIMEQEAYYLRFLGDIHTYRFVGEQLRLRDSGHEELTYVRRSCGKSERCPTG